MAIKVPDHTVIVFRNGKQVVVAPGKGFDFTDEEIADIEASRPDSLRDVVDTEVLEAPEAEKAPKGKKAESDSL